MNIYIVTALEKGPGRFFESMIVYAESAKAARNMHPDPCGGWKYPGKWVTSPLQTKARYLGTDEKRKKPRLILTQYVDMGA